MPAPERVTRNARSIASMLDAERRALLDLRDSVPVPSGGGWERRLSRAIAAAECPACAPLQADGVPCESADRACDQCAEALAWVRAQRLGLEAEARAASSVR